VLRLSRETGLGLLLLVSLSRLEQDEGLGLKGWAKEQGLPYRFLSKVAVKMKKAGLLRSKEGRGGGYYLAKKADKVKLNQVLRVLEGKMEPVRCMRGIKCGVEAECGHKLLMERLVKLLEQELEKMSLVDLVRE